MRKFKIFSRTLALVLSLCMLTSLAPLVAGAYTSETHTVFSRTTSTIAPGVTQDICYAYANDGNQMVYYVATADITRDDVNVYANYKDNQCTEFGMSKLTEQMVAAQEKHSNPDDTDNYIENYSVVAGVNADFYNMTTGQPSGAFVMEGTITNNANNRPFFAILKDGTPVIGANNTDWNAIADQVQEAVGGSQVLVKDGADITASASGSYNTDRHSRTCVGITADGQVVMMVLDGRQVPFSCGGSMHELAQIMLEAGCVSAINLDGGGSTTFAAKQEGEDEVTIVNRPSDGSERSISSSLMIVSTAVPSNVFDRAVLTAENNYVTPGSTVNVSATGVSPAGTSAEIPADVTWQLADSSLGSVENGVFTSNGTTGDAVVQMVYNGNVVGETTIKVVVPDTIKFNSSVITVPYDKTINFDMTATYGLNEVTLKDGDVTFSFSDDAMGSIDGFKFTACEEASGITGGTVTATVTFNTSVACTAEITFGKGSEIVQDFENGVPDSYSIITTYPQYGPMGNQKDANGNYYYNGQNECGKIYAVNSETGKVRNGTGAMAVECDYTQIYETGWHGLNLNGISITADASAQAIGMWVYLPELEDIVATNVRAVGKTTSGTTVNAEFWQVGYTTSLECDGWRYFTFDLSQVNEAVTFSCIQLYINDRDGSDYNYYFKNNSSVNGKFTYYIDDITIDYSSAVDDREVPVFNYVRASYGGLSDAVELKGQTINSNVVSVTAKATDDTTLSNYTGLDVSTAKAYIDGIELTSGFTCTDDGIMTIDDVTLADGVHTFKFEICDKMGNLSYIERNIKIAADSDIPNVTFVPNNPDEENVLIGSVQWFDLVASDIENVKSIKTTVNLNSVSTWDLDNMNVAFGFEASYTVDEVTNNATITITRKESASLVTLSEGGTVVASLPVRTWVSRLTEYEGYEASTPEKLWSRKIIWPMDIKISVISGSVVYTDNTTGSFSSDDYVVTTELYGNYAELNANGDYSNKTSWHVHTAKAIDDLEATCVTDGYTGRTYCEECSSVVDWGTTEPATGHNYVLKDDLMVCEGCTISANGYVDGKYYIDGVAAKGWQTIDEKEYYFTEDSIPAVGSVMIDDKICTFDENGVYMSDYMYSGFYEAEEGCYYILNNNKMSGWRVVDDKYYYFDDTTFLMVSGEKTIDGVKYVFEDNGELINGTFVNTSSGTLYYFAGRAIASRWIEVDGKKYRANEKGYICKGISPVHISTGASGLEWHNFDETTGEWIEAMDGFFQYDGYTYYAEDGKPASGRIELNGEYYHFRTVPLPGRMVTNQYYVGYYYGADGTMPDNEFAEFNGNTYYFVNGDICCNGLTKVGDDIYYFSTSSGLMKYGKYYVSVTNDLVPSVGYYYFDDNGHLATNGYFTINGEEVYFADYKISTPPVAPALGLVEKDGKYYYVDAEGNNMTGKVDVTVTNGLLSEGTYYFAEDGHMYNEEVAAPEGTYYYYSMGQVSGSGLMFVNGYYYYVSTSTQKLIVDRSYWTTVTNDLLPAALYEFGSDGKMLNAPAQPDLTVKGLIEKDGKYYYSDADGNYMTGEVNVSVTNDLLPAGIYYFAEDGHMLDNEVVALEGTYYYFSQGKISGAGLILVDGYYYYVSTSTQKIVVDRSYWTTSTNDLLPAALYQFGSDGKMLNPPVN